MRSPVRVSSVLLAAALSLLTTRSSEGFHVPPPTIGRRGGSACCGAAAAGAPRLRRRNRAEASASSSMATTTASATTEASAALLADDEQQVVSEASSTLPSLDDDPLVSHPSVSSRRWKTMYLRLQKYAQIHGHCRVPRRYDPDPSLGAWVAHQRFLRGRRRRGLPARGVWNSSSPDGREEGATMHMEGEGDRDGHAANSITNPLTDPRIAALDALNFTWDVREKAWRDRLEQLGRYRAERGDCLVPPSYPDRGLATFVRNQRRQYARYVAAAAGGRRGNNASSSSTSTLTPSRVEELRDVGFHFGTNHTSMWDTRYGELVEYAAERDHANVPEKHDANPALGAWVAHQRLRYRESTLRSDRVAALERIDGFRWDVRTKSWETMLERLRVHANVTGSFVVGGDDQDNQDLRTWVRVQRYHRALRERGEPSPSLSDARVDALDGIGFPWTPRRGPQRANGTEEEVAPPSRADWSKLFEELKDRGIDAGGEAKEHWFDKERSFEKEGEELKEWDEADVVSLWEQGDPEDDW